MIRIRSKKEGFRRCGIAHSEKSTEYANDRFTGKQIEILKSDPMLLVEEIADPEPKEKTEPETRNMKPGIKK